MENNAPLAVSNIIKSFGNAQVLKDVSFSLEAGEIFGLIGVNGAGKTTLIKLILDLADADKGDIMLFGESSTDVKARRHLSYLPEKFQPSRYLKGSEYVSLSLSYYKKPFVLNAAREKAAELDLDPAKLEFRVSAYSKGMGQKLGLLGALLADMPLYILDEPMSGLDPSARIKLKDQLLRLKAEGKTVFFSSHILADIEEICDRIGVLHDGRLLFVGAPAEFKAQQRQQTLELAFLNAIEA